MLDANNHLKNSGQYIEAINCVWFQNLSGHVLLMGVVYLWRRHEQCVSVYIRAPNKEPQLKYSTLQLPFQSADHTPRTSSLVCHFPWSPSPAIQISRSLSPVSPGVVEAGVSVQQVAEMLVRFVLASDNPELREALKRVINSDPNITKRL